MVSSGRRRRSGGARWRAAEPDAPRPAGGRPDAWLGETAWPRGLRSRFDGVEVIEEDAGQLLAVAGPVRARGIVVQAGDPVDVELVDGGVDAIAFEPAVAESPRVPERLVGAP